MRMKLGSSSLEFFIQHVETDAFCHLMTKTWRNGTFRYVSVMYNKPLPAARLNGSDLCRNVLNPSADSLCCRTSSHSLGWLIHGPLSGRELHTSKSFDLLDLWQWACNPISIEPLPARGTSSFQRSCSQDGRQTRASSMKPPFCLRSEETLHQRWIETAP